MISFNPNLLELMFRLGTPSVDSGRPFPPEGSHIIFQVDQVICEEAPFEVVIGTRIDCKLRCTSDGKLGVVAPTEVLKRLKPECFTKRRKTSRSPQPTQHEDAILIDKPGNDGELCSHISKYPIPLAAVKGPTLHISPNRSIILQFGLALVTDASVVTTRQQNTALKFLARVLEDPTLINPQGYTASPLDLLAIITRGREDPEKAPNLTVNGLNTSLLPFQRQTVHWLLGREGKTIGPQGTLQDLDPYDRDHIVTPALGWRLAPGTDIWVNPYILKTSSKEPVIPRHIDDFSGKGLLAEEMGLGKTLEIISLTLLHQRPSQSFANKIYVNYENTAFELRKVKATLVIVPKTILQQWVSEVKTHAPHLNTLVVTSPNPKLDDLSAADIVFVTYSQLSRWMAHTEVREKRQTRGASRYQFEVPDDIDTHPERRRSTLIEVQFWRVVLDEVQMVHSGASAAAITARRIPRVHAWASSGTPVKHSLEDIRGIIYFLNLHPFVERPCWQRLIASPVDFEKCMQSIAIRHTKPLVANQLHIPPQHRKLSLLKFSVVERLRYERLFREFEEDAKDSNCNLFIWLLKLRQICSHILVQPNISSQSLAGVLNNTSAGQAGLEYTDVVALTLDQVLNQLVDEADSEIWSEQRESMVLRLDLGLLYDKSDNLDKAIESWKSVVQDIEMYNKNVVNKIKEVLNTQKQQQNLIKEVESRIKPIMDDQFDDNITALDELNDDKRDDEQKLGDDTNYSDLKRNLMISQNRIKSLNLRYKSLQELLHRAFFFIGTGYFRKSQRMKLKLSEEALELGENQEILSINYENETKYYDFAEKIRAEILKEAERKVNSLNAGKKQLKLINVNKHCKVPKAQILDKLSAFLLEVIDSLYCILEQPLIEESREELAPGVQAETDAYSKTLDLQEHAFEYLEIFQILLKDRAAVINGGNISPFPSVNDSSDNCLAKTLVNKRQEIVETLYYDKAPLITIMKATNVPEKILDTLKSEIKECQDQYATLRDLYNARVDYYKQLQDLSDQVTDIDAGNQTDYYKQIQGKQYHLQRVEERIHEKFKNLTYLLNLEGSNHSATQKRTEPEKNGQIYTNSHCTICLEAIFEGAMTQCGHVFCSDCLIRWLTVSGTCPLCKRYINKNEIRTFIPNTSVCDTEMKELVNKEDSTKKSPKPDADENYASDLYVPISNRLYNNIHKISLPRMYGVKIDMIVRHVKYIRLQDPTAQIVIFSQWATMLKVLRTAFAENKIIVAVTNDSVIGVNEFRTNPDVACLLLHAKADVAGLTLVNANHVFLCEPLINTAIELQAVSRINRIGQLRETLVWQFCVENTVEQTILGMTTKARLLQTVVDGDMVTADSTTLAEAATQRALVDRKSGAEIISDSQALRRILFREGGS